jgi:hypothetical protein
MKGLVEGVNHAFKIQSSYTFKFHSKKKKKKKTNFSLSAIGHHKRDHATTKNFMICDVSIIFF